MNLNVVLFFCIHKNGIASSVKVDLLKWTLLSGISCTFFLKMSYQCNIHNDELSTPTVLRKRKWRSYPVIHLALLLTWWSSEHAMCGSFARFILSISQIHGFRFVWVFLGVDKYFGTDIHTNTPSPIFRLGFAVAVAVAVVVA